MDAQWRPRATEEEYLELLDEYSVKHGRIVREEEEDELNINRHGQFDELNHQTLTIPQNLGQQRHLTEESDEGSLPDAESDPERFKQKTIYDEFANKDSHKSQATSQSRIRDYADNELRNEYKLKCPPLLQVTISQNKWKRKVIPSSR
jgi:hypothetical protein